MAGLGFSSSGKKVDGPWRQQSVVVSAWALEPDC